SAHQERFAKQPHLNGALGEDPRRERLGQRQIVRRRRIGKRDEGVGKVALALVRSLRVIGKRCWVETRTVREVCQASNRDIRFNGWLFGVQDNKQEVSPRPLVRLYDAQRQRSWPCNGDRRAIVVARYEIDGVRVVANLRQRGGEEEGVPAPDVVVLERRADLSLDGLHEDGLRAGDEASGGRSLD